MGKYLFGVNWPISQHAYVSNSSIDYAKQLCDHPEQTYLYENAFPIRESSFSWSDSAFRPYR
jgi:hypothetical protein